MKHIVGKIRKLKHCLRGTHSSQKSVRKLGQTCLYLSLQSGPKTVFEQLSAGCYVFPLGAEEQMTQCCLNIANSVYKVLRNV